MFRFTALAGATAALTIAIAASLYSTAAQSTPAVPANTKLPDGPGKDVVMRTCLSCHNASVIVAQAGHTEDEWTDIVSQMVGRGAILSDEDADTVIQYLSTSLGPGSAKGKSSASPAAGGSEASSNKTDSTEASGEKADAASADSSSTTPVNVNKAGVEELESALGLTQAEAQAIVQYRGQHGSFKNWQEVSSVPGVPSDKIKESQKRLAF